MRELPKNLFGICMVCLALLGGTIAVLRTFCHEFVLQSVWEAAQTAQGSSAFKESAVVVAVTYLLFGGWSLAVALSWGLVHLWLAGRLVAGSPDHPDTPGNAALGTDDFAEAYQKIEADLTGLGSQIHGEYASSLTGWRKSTEHFMRLCQWYRQEAINPLMEMMPAQGPLKVSVERVREEITKGFAETMSILERKQSSKEGYQEQFNQAAISVWDMAKRVRGYADQLVATG